MPGSELVREHDDAQYLGRMMPCLLPLRQRRPLGPVTFLVFSFLIPSVAGCMVLAPSTSSAHHNRNSYPLYALTSGRSISFSGIRLSLATGKRHRETPPVLVSARPGNAHRVRRFQRQPWDNKPCASAERSVRSTGVCSSSPLSSIFRSSRAPGTSGRYAGFCLSG